MEKQTNEYDLMIAIINKIHPSNLLNSTDQIIDFFNKLNKAIKESK